MENVYIASAVRTPQGSFGGMLASFAATELGTIAIRGALSRAGVKPEAVDEVFMGNVVSANLGQAPARQAALGAGLGMNVPCTTVNKVCSSGMKAIMFGAQSIMLGHNHLVVAGGMESMSNIPYYLPRARWGLKYGDGQLVDGLAKDGLTDAYNQTAMGISGDRTAEKYGISREAQDAYAIRSYQQAAEATEAGWFAREIVPVEAPQRRGDPLTLVEDEEYKRVRYDKIPKLKPAFSPDGTITAANASTINDGASALVLVSETKMKELDLKPLARIRSFADAAQDPMWFTTAPSLAAPRAMDRAGVKPEDIDFFEVNEAFSVVPMVFARDLNVDEHRLNVFGGGVSLGHPLGSSGSRIVCTLLSVLEQRDGQLGLATLCNGGGGASALVVERV